MTGGMVSKPHSLHFVPFRTKGHETSIEFCAIRGVVPVILTAVAVFCVLIRFALHTQTGVQYVVYSWSF